MSKNVVLEKYKAEQTPVIVRLRVPKRSRPERVEKTPANLFSIGNDVLRYVILKDIGWYECVLLRQVCREFRQVIEPVMLKLAMAEFADVRAYHIEHYGATRLNGEECRRARNYFTFLREQCGSKLLLMKTRKVLPLKRTDMVAFGLKPNEKRKYKLRELFMLSLKLYKTVGGLRDRRTVLNNQRDKARDVRYRYDMRQEEKRQREIAIKEEKEQKERQVIAEATALRNKEATAQRDMRLEQLNAILIGHGFGCIKQEFKLLSPAGQESARRLTRFYTAEVPSNTVEKTVMDIVDELIAKRAEREQHNQQLLDLFDMF